VIISPNKINPFITIKETQRVYCTQGTNYVQRSPKFAQLVKKPTTFYRTRKFINVITNTIPNLKNPMRQRILHFPVNYAKVFGVNSFLPHA